MTGGLQSRRRKRKARLSAAERGRALRRRRSGAALLMLRLALLEAPPCRGLRDDTSQRVCRGVGPAVHAAVRGAELFFLLQECAMRKAPEKSPDGPPRKPGWHRAQTKGMSTTNGTKPRGGHTGCTGGGRRRTIGFQRQGEEAMERGKSATQCSTDIFQSRRTDTSSLKRPTAGAGGHPPGRVTVEHWHAWDKEKILEGSRGEKASHAQSVSADSAQTSLGAGGWLGRALTIRDENCLRARILYPAKLSSWAGGRIKAFPDPCGPKNVSSNLSEAARGCALQI